jgi:hypothetical protein
MALCVDDGVSVFDFLGFFVGGGGAPVGDAAGLGAGGGRALLSFFCLLLLLLLLLLPLPPPPPPLEVATAGELDMEGVCGVLLRGLLEVDAVALGWAVGALSWHI